MKKIIVIIALLFLQISIQASDALAEYTSGEVVPQYVLNATTFNNTNTFEEDELVVINMQGRYVFAEYVDSLLDNASEISLNQNGRRSILMMLNNQIGKIDRNALINDISSSRSVSPEAEMHDPDAMEE